MTLAIISSEHVIIFNYYIYSSLWEFYRSKITGKYKYLGNIKVNQELKEELDREARIIFYLTFKTFILSEYLLYITQVLC